MKKAEDENALVVRFYEWAGKQARLTLQLPPGAESATETDLMEKPTGSLSLNGSSRQRADQAVRDQDRGSAILRCGHAGGGKAMSPPILGVDIGGTKVAVGIVDRDGKILAQGRKPMVANGTAKLVCKRSSGRLIR